MGKYYCSYCDVFLTHDSQSVRKAHNSGRNHLANVRDYYAGLSHEKAQQIINQITSSYENMPRGGPSGLPLAHAQMRLGPGFMNPQLGPPMGMPMMGGMPPFQPPFPGQYGAPPPQFRPPFPPPPGMGAPPPMPNGAGSPAAFRPPGQPGMPPAPTFTPASGPPTGAQPGVHPDRIRMMGV